MGYARLALYLAGLLIVVAGAWVFLTQTPVEDVIHPGFALAIILLLVGIGVMAGARAMDDATVSRRRVVRDTDYLEGGLAPGTYYTPPERRETVVEERREL